MLCDSDRYSYFVVVHVFIVDPSLLCCASDTFTLDCPVHGLQGVFDNAREDEYCHLPKAGLRQAAAHRWVSGTALLERFLVSYDDVVSHYAKSKGARMGANSKQEARHLQQTIQLKLERADVSHFSSGKKVNMPKRKNIQFESIPHGYLRYSVA